MIKHIKVSLFNKGLLASTVSDNPAWTADSGAEAGRYTFNMSYMPEGDYQILVEKDGKQSSAMLKVAGNYSTFTAKTIALKNYAVSPAGTPPQATPTATAPPVLTPTPDETANATVAPSNATATPFASGTPVPTPGSLFTLIPALAIICLIALRKRN